jgi:hypothetical protein
MPRRIHSASEPAPTGAKPNPKPAGDTAPVHDLIDSPADVLAAKRPDLVEQLGLLDDTVFEAIAGRPGAFERLRVLWPELKQLVGPRLLEESREQYARHALGVWRHCMAGEELSNPALALAAMEVLSLLFDE